MNEDAKAVEAAKAAARPEQEKREAERKLDFVQLAKLDRRNCPIFEECFGV